MNTFITYLDNFCEIIEVNFESYDNLKKKSNCPMTHLLKEVY